MTLGTSIGKFPAVADDLFNSEHVFRFPVAYFEPNLSVLTENHGYSQGEADYPHRCRIHSPEQQDNCCGGWTGWDGLCYQHPGKGTAQGQPAIQVPIAVMLCSACLS